MFSFLIRHSLVLMFGMALLGFLLPTWSLALFPFLPYVLFVIMMLTLLGIKQSALLMQLKQKQIWLYALFHSFVLMLVSYCFALIIGAEENLVVAMVAVAATGSLFGTPAIVRALGFDVMAAMAMTIASTLLLPIAIYLVLILLQSDAVTLDMQEYFIRLSVFIFGPMLFSFLIHKLTPQAILTKVLSTISPYTILFVFAFPFGLIGSFRLLWDQDASAAYYYFFLAVGLLTLFFVTAFFLYRKQGEQALVAALTSGNRNVLLTYSIAGSLLGPAFLPLAGALQIPTYLLPLITKLLAKRLKQKTK